eukprot:CAMPEP_0204513994 /NCGR_PEP_ID=MMETSP0661-20131031/1811_1 /ASSEMBLY_ACC=CAM_ASM_000606 /TAXON_ID=109239 /ORGANISM="Alexandrium margalefi, Strain AMGDE01CS-322" /LENGTH=164 /DNA_ID=CAMNT_0051519205 /DNA_START=49 /DNA_END=539 /DNA_ORIENTATION=+
MAIPKTRPSVSYSRGGGLQQDSGIVFVQTQVEWQRLLSEKRPAVVMFTSRICGACMAMKGDFLAMASYFPKEDFTLAMVDLDKSDRAITTSALGQVAFVPAFQIYCGGDRLDYFIANDKDTLKEKMDKAKHDIEEKKPDAKAPPRLRASCAGGCLSGLWALRRP